MIVAESAVILTARFWVLLIPISRSVSAPFVMLSPVWFCVKGLPPAVFGQVTFVPDAVATPPTLRRLWTVEVLLPTAPLHVNVTEIPVITDVLGMPERSRSNVMSRPEASRPFRMYVAVLGSATSPKQLVPFTTHCSPAVLSQPVVARPPLLTGTRAPVPDGGSV
ncbi:MAG: hypothetical protein CVU47_08650 [Chloroflexi bacterium HGW-Chloroflexi-9]|nr:MAG: hypothetical protein CVU47_08650 [Chloroflexi bacterium HGW-Chloroflexi-9]